MSFLTPEEQAEIGYFDWQDGQTYHLSVKKNWENGFAKQNAYELLFVDLDSGKSFTMKYQFDLINAINLLGDKYKNETTPLKITSAFVGMVPSKKDPEKEYKKWSFLVEIADGTTPVKTEDEQAF